MGVEGGGGGGAQDGEGGGGVSDDAVRFKAGDVLVARNGNRRVRLECRQGVLWAVPLNENQGMAPEPLAVWLGWLVDGAELFRGGSAPQ